MVKLLETELYNALKQLRKAEEAFANAKFCYNVFVMQRKRKGKAEALDDMHRANLRLYEAQEAADELLARLGADFVPVEER